MKTKRAGLYAAALCAAALLCFDARAQTPRTAPAQTQQQTPEAQSGAPSAETLTSEVSLLRKSLQTLNARLREISDRLLAPGPAAQQPDASNSGNPSNNRQSRLVNALNLLTLAEQRAETMRRQLLELTEKEAFYKNRLIQIDESSRPENVDRSIALYGTTTSNTDLRDTRRRVLDNERGGVLSLLNQTTQSRMRLEDDLKQADALVARLRQRLLPLIEKEIDKINPEANQ